MMMENEQVLEQLQSELRQKLSDWIEGMCLPFEDFDQELPSYIDETYDNG